MSASLPFCLDSGIRHIIIITKWMVERVKGVTDKYKYQIRVS